MDQAGKGSISLTNTGGITLQSRGNTVIVDGGDIQLDSQDGNILLKSVSKLAAIKV